MAKKDPAALLYIDTWKVATTEMSAIERAYYMDLILHQYDKGSLPNDIEELANICRVRFSEFEQFKQVFEQVLKQKFKENERGRLENEFASEIIRKRQKFVEKRSSAGKLSYVLRYFRANFKINKKLEQFIKDNIDLEFNIKDEQMLKQVFEQISELYINGNKDEDIIKPDYINIFNKLNFELELRDDFKEQILLWLKYKSEKNQSYKETGMRTLIKGLLKDSDNNIETASEMIEYSMKNNYAGIFKLKSNQDTTKSHIQHDTDY